MDSGIHIVGKSGHRERFSTYNPATGEPIADYLVASAEDVTAAVDNLLHEAIQLGTTAAKLSVA